MPFHNRSDELERLTEACRSDRAELFIMYGRRGVGKSTLLVRSVTGVRHIFYRATRRTLPLQLHGLTAMVREAYSEGFIPATFTSFEEFLRFLAATAKREAAEPVIVIIDELPYLADVDRGLLTVLQTWWDQHKNLANLKLFLAGSYVSFMERQVLDANAPLYNRRTGAMRLEPFDYSQAALFFPGYTPRMHVETYAILGGMPSYLEQFDPDRGLDENLLSTALRRNTFLNEEPDWLLLEDLRKDATYGSILRAIATGNRKPSDIARAIGKQSAQDIGPQLQSLLELALVRREVPITDRLRPGSRNSLYWLADNYLAFWYRYVDPNRSLIAQGLEQRVLERIKQSLHEHVARPPFEDMCRQFLWRSYRDGRLPTEVEFNAVGSWWSKSSEIDVVAQEGSATRLVGSCKWTNAPMDTGDLHRLRQALTDARSELNPAPGCWYALFSRQGFDESLVTVARQPVSRVLLFTPEDLFA